MGPATGGYSYTRSANPTRSTLEERLAELANGESALAFASGMGAIGTALMSLLEAGDQVVAFNYLYGGTRKLLDEIYAPSFDLEIDYVDATSVSAVEEAVRDETTLIWIESPTNPLLKLCDIEAIANIADSHDVTFCVDNTFASPCTQQPLDLGADVVVHSTTKYINGHSDSLGGAMITRDEELAASVHHAQKYGTGSVLSPFDSYLVLRGLKTLPARMQRHGTNAMMVAEFLDGHPTVEQVHYPGLPSHPQHDLAKDQMNGYSGMLSFEIDGGESEAATMLKELEQIQLAVSLSGIESLIAHVSTMTHHYLSDEMLATMGIDDSLIRMSVGIENPDDLFADLEQALASI